MLPEVLEKQLNEVLKNINTDDSLLISESIRILKKHCEMLMDENFALVRKIYTTTIFLKKQKSKATYEQILDMLNS